MDDKELIKIWQIVVGGIVIILLAVVSCNIHVNSKIAESIKSGASPILVNQAFSYDQSITQLEVLEAIKKGGNNDRRTKISNGDIR